MDRTIVLPYEPTNSPLSSIPGTAAGHSSVTLVYTYLYLAGDWLGKYISFVLPPTIRLPYVTFEPPNIAAHIVIT
jgi:hypothetical protein